MDLLATHQAQFHSLAKEGPSTRTGSEVKTSAPLHILHSTETYTVAKNTQMIICKNKTNKS